MSVWWWLSLRGVSRAALAIRDNYLSSWDRMTSQRVVLRANGIRALVSRAPSASFARKRVDLIRQTPQNPRRPSRLVLRD